MTDLSKTEAPPAELAAWLSWVLDEQEAVEQARRTWNPDAPAMDVSTTPGDEGVLISRLGSSVQHWLSTEDYERSYLVPAPSKQALARIAADREILAIHSGDRDWPCQEGNYAYEPCETLKALASAYADRPGYQESWKP